VRESFFLGTNLYCRNSQCHQKVLCNRRQDMLEVIMEGLMRKMNKLSTKIINRHDASSPKK
jgi:hypothetical protein